jgi:NAD(P)-dependent dehydrogenase (short-subunit alcohol dehydrogenase family)
MGQLLRQNVRVNAVAPGIIATPMHGADEGTQAFLKTLAPNGAIGETQDVVNAVLYLTDSTHTSGTVMAVDSGATAGTW